MRTHILYVPLICITFTNWSEALNFYTGTVTTNTSNVIFDTLLSGNDLFENLYGTFNNTGLLLFGGALLLGSGKLDGNWLRMISFSWQYWWHHWPIGQLNANVSNARTSWEWSSYHRRTQQNHSMNDPSILIFFSLQKKKIHLDDLALIDEFRLISHFSYFKWKCKSLIVKFHEL